MLLDPRGDKSTSYLRAGNLVLDSYFTVAEKGRPFPYFDFFISLLPFLHFLTSISSFPYFHFFTSISSFSYFQFFISILPFLHFHTSISSFSYFAIFNSFLHLDPCTPFQALVNPLPPQPPPSHYFVGCPESFGPQ